jgi:hypothetical protein
LQNWVGSPLCCIAGASALSSSRLAYVHARKKSWKQCQVRPEACWKHTSALIESRSTPAASHSSSSPGCPKRNQSHWQTGFRWGNGRCRTKGSGTVGAGASRWGPLRRQRRGSAAFQGRHAIVKGCARGRPGTRAVPCRVFDCIDGRQPGSAFDARVNPLALIPTGSVLATTSAVPSVWYVPRRSASKQGRNSQPEHLRQGQVCACEGAAVFPGRAAINARRRVCRRQDSSGQHRPGIGGIQVTSC